MKRVALLGCLSLVALVVGLAHAEDKSIKEIMKSSHQGADSFLGKAKAATGKKGNLADLAKITKDWLKDAEALSKATPSKGDKESWAKLTKAYTDNVKAADKAAADNKPEDAAKAVAALSGSCGGCHKVHK
jgi:hypothetical protein